MIELAFVVCLIGDDKTCREESLLFADMPVRACILGAQTELAVWAGAHAGWQITRWTCRPLAQGAVEI